jgi:acetylornithine deacetylase/succinyl-diaminopimelate desuccinylase-like protein
MGRHLCAVLACGALALTGASASAQSDAQIAKSAQANFAEFFDMLALPNDAIVPVDIQRNANWLEVAFKKRGFTTRQLPNNGRPLVFAEYPRKVADAKTILFYMHFDGQPVIPSQWSQKSPWTATLRQRVGAKWEEIDAKRLQDGVIDPEWRIFARSSSDDKGPIMMFLTAFDAMKAAGVEPAINVKVILDSEEEKGSPAIGMVASAHKDLLEADAIAIHDGPMHASNRPTIIFGNRGNTVVRLTVYGPKMNLHSGHYGNYAPNPAQRLAALLASMKDDDGRVTITGYYDSVKLTDAEHRIMADVPDDDAALRKRLGIAKPEAVGKNLQEAIQYPSLNIRGMQSADIGEKAANILPSQATAELDLRTTPGADPTMLADLIEKHIRSKGYYLTKEPPTDEERAAHDKIASFVVARGSAAAFTPFDSAVGVWAQASLEKSFAKDRQPAKIVRIRMMGGSVPTDKLVSALGLPFVIIPLVNSDNNQHSFDENIRLGHYLEGIRAFTGLLSAPF